MHLWLQLPDFFLPFLHPSGLPCSIIHTAVVNWTFQCFPYLNGLLNTAAIYHNLAGCCILVQFLLHHLAYCFNYISLNLLHLISNISTGCGATEQMHILLGDTHCLGKLILVLWW